MDVLSLFDGMSCGQIALNRCAIKYENYYVSEIDKYAIAVTQANFPTTKQLGDVRNITGKMLPKIDLLIGGSPCQGFSFAGKGLNFEDERSKLFFEWVRLWKELQPCYWLLENVRMKKEYENIINEILGCKPLRINSALVSAQNRERLYWTNIPVNCLPEDKRLLLKDIIESGIPCHVKNQGKQVHKINVTKSVCLLARDYKGFGNQEMTAIDDCGLRKLTPLEYERLQNVPDNYTAHVSNTQRYKMLGNGWTVDVICHIFKFMEF